MEQRGNNHPKNVIAVIPARLNSTRLPNKLIQDVCGKPLILHTVARALSAKTISRVVVATDSEDILNIVSAAGFEAVMTSPAHQSGSDRIAEVAASIDDAEIIVNVQGDEPLIHPETIDAAVNALLDDENADISTTCEAIKDADAALNPDVVKVVTDTNGNALYFSRSTIPFPRDLVKKHGSLQSALSKNIALLTNFSKHTGLYVYRRAALLRFTSLAPSPLEKLEMLEQLRALENGMRIKVVLTERSSIGVDTAEDLEKVRRIVEQNNK